MFMILLTTCQLQKDRLADLFRLTASVEPVILDGEVDKLRHIILLQGCTSQQCDEIRIQLPNWVELLSSEKSLSSPAARNAMIRHLLDEEAIDPSAIVGFPDDDAWYPGGSLACVARQFGDPHLQLLFSPTVLPSADQCGEAFRPTLQQALSRGACAQFSFAPPYWRSSAGFTLRLALGPSLAAARIPSSCTAPFIVRASTVFGTPGFLVGHAAADPKKKAASYEGGLAAIMAHSHILRQRAWPSSANWRSALGWWSLDACLLRTIFNR